MKRTAVIALGAAGLLAGATYWTMHRRPAYCDDLNRTLEQTSECARYDRQNARLRDYFYHSSGSSSSSSWNGSSGGHVSSVPRGGFGSTGFHLSGGG